jgi:hypothetical protein
MTSFALRLLSDRRRIRRNRQGRESPTIPNLITRPWWRTGSQAEAHVSKRLASLQILHNSDGFNGDAA